MRIAEAIITIYIHIRRRERSDDGNTELTLRIKISPASTNGALYRHIRIIMISFDT